MADEKLVIYFHWPNVKIKKNKHELKILINIAGLGHNKKIKKTLVGKKWNGFDQTPSGLQNQHFKPLNPLMLLHVLQQ
jgi:hypothetical protein